MDLNVTKREMEVLTLLSFGLTRNEIAARIFLSTNTVSTYLKSLAKKFNTNNKAQLVMKGFQHGILTVSDSLTHSN